MTYRLPAWGVAIVLAGLLSAHCSAAQDAAAFYHGKTVRFVVGTGVGGGYDSYARMIAPYLGKALAATVVVQNETGAGGVTALNLLYAAAPDGLQIELVNGNAAVAAQLIEQASVRYDMAKFDYLGIVGSNAWIWLASPTSPYATPADAVKAGGKLRWAGIGVTDLSDGAAVTCAALALDCAIVKGYPGSSDAALAVARGEMDAMVNSEVAALNYVRAGTAKPIAMEVRQRSRLFPDLPTIFEALDLTKEQQWWFDFRAAMGELGRVAVAAPGTPRDRLDFLQASFKNALSDPELMAQATRTQQEIGYVDAARAKRLAVSLIDEPTPEEKARYKAALLKEWR